MHAITETPVYSVVDCTDVEVVVVLVEVITIDEVVMVMVSLDELTMIADTVKFIEPIVVKLRPYSHTIFLHTILRQKDIATKRYCDIDTL